MLKAIRRKIYRVLSTVKSDLSYQLALSKHAKKLPTLTAQDQLIVEACRKDGAFVTSLEALGLASTPKMLQAAEKLLVEMQAVLVRQTDMKTWGTCENPAYPQIFTVTDLPEFVEWATDQRLLNIVEHYLGLPAEFQGVHLRRDFANERPVTTELWHKDLEDRRVIKIFVYLSDVIEETGPYEYIPKSHVTPAIARQIDAAILQRVIAKPGDLGIDDTEMAAIVPRSRWKACEGSAGMVLFSDAVAVFHHGKSRQKGRSALFFVYTTQKPLRPEACTQYHDRTFARPDQLQPQI